MQENNNEIRPVVYGVMGAIAGAAIALLLSKRENREKLSRTFAEWAREGKEMLGSVKQKAYDYARNTDEDLDERLDELKNAVSELSEEIEKKRSRRKRDA